MDKQALQVGVNLGGWISQYPAYDYDHFDRFITAEDIHRIADWGCDHDRLPVDYPVLELENEAGKPNERGMEYVYKCFRWCKESGLNVILDLHKAPGFVFDNLQASTLFNDPAQQARFLNLWAMILDTFRENRDFVAFELLNEIALPDGAPWNLLARKTIERIRSTDPTCLIVIGGNYYNSASQLAALEWFDDSNILYTFHFYEPLVVTHQGAYWVPALLDYHRAVDYPGTAAEFDQYIQSHPEHQAYLGRYVGKFLDRPMLLEDVRPAIDFATEHGVPVYCGEFGVIDKAPLQTRLNWNRDLVSIFKENAIGRAYWTYKGKDFGLVDESGQVIDQALVDVVCSP